MPRLMDTLSEMFNLSWIAPDLSGHHGPIPNTHTAQYLADHLGGEILNSAKHGNITTPLHDMADALGLSYKPLVIVSERVPLGPTWSQHLPNAVAMQQGIIIVNKPLMDLSGSSTQSFSPGLNSVMAHELSHLKHDASPILSHLRRITAPILIPSAAMAGLYYFDKAAKQSKHVDDMAAAQQHIHHMADAHIDALNQQQGPVKLEPKAYTPLVNTARYLAVGLAGLAGSLMLNRHISLAAEFRADRVAVELAQAPEALIGLLHDMQQESIAFTKEVRSNPQLLQQINPTTLAQKIELKQHMIQGEYFGAHPEETVRFANIRKHAQALGLAKGEAGTITRSS